MVTLIIGHSKDMIREDTSKLIQVIVIISNKGEAWEASSVKVFWFQVPEPNSNTGSFEQKGTNWEDIYKYIYRHNTHSLSSHPSPSSLHLSSPLVLSSVPFSPSRNMVSTLSNNSETFI